MPVKKDKQEKIWNYGPVITPEQPNTEIKPHEQDVENSEWVKAFFPLNNYFAELADKASNSPTHLSCINSKSFFTAGDGFNLEYGTRSIKERKSSKNISDEQADIIDNLIDNASINGDSLNEISYNLSGDYYLMGNAYALLILSKEGNAVRCFLDYRDGVNCRVSKADSIGRIKKVGYSPNWNQENGNEKEFALEQFGRWPYWTLDKGSGAISNKKGLDILSSNFKTAYSIVHIRNLTNKHYYYGLPDSISCLIYQQVESAIGEENIDELENGFMPNILMQAIIQASKKEKDEFYDAIDQTFTRAGNAKKKSRIFKNMVSNEKGMIKVDKLAERPKEGAYLELSDLAAQKIMTANRWHPILASIQTSGKLGNNNEIREIVQMAQNTVIVPIQNKLVEKVITPYLKLNKIDGYWLSIANVSPVSFAGSIKPSEVLTKNEQRGELGYQDLDKEGLKELQNANSTGSDKKTTD